MQQFEIIIKNEKIKSYRRIILLIVVLHVILFTFLLFSKEYKKEGFEGFTWIALYSLYKVFASIRSFEKFYFGTGFFFVFGVLTINFIPWLWIADLLFYVLSTFALQKIIFQFSAILIKQKNFPWKKCQWEQLSNVILKDNILTLDFKNNKLFQAEIENTDIDQDQFNAFAKNHLTKDI